MHQCWTSFRLLTHTQAESAVGGSPRLCSCIACPRMLTLLCQLLSVCASALQSSMQVFASCLAHCRANMCYRLCFTLEHSSLLEQHAPSTIGNCWGYLWCCVATRELWVEEVMSGGCMAERCHFHQLSAPSFLQLRPLPCNVKFLPEGNYSAAYLAKVTGQPQVVGGLLDFTG